MRDRIVEVLGPAYLDRVLRVDGPILDASQGPPLDLGVDGEWEKQGGEGLELIAPDGFTIAITVPTDWPGPRGIVRLSRPPRVGALGRRAVVAIDWRDDLGGMGAGFAAALGGRLTSALGPETDPTSQAVARLLERYGVVHHPLRVPDHAADWTLLVSSGPFGDKFPVGFRGCHAAIGADALASRAIACDLRVVAGLANSQAARLLAAPGARARLFAPTIRNMLDCSPPVHDLAASIDVFCCNQAEWMALEAREEVAWRVSVLSVTDGARGARVQFTMPDGSASVLDARALGRDHPPRDTNRAGEAFAAALIQALLDGGWDATGGVVEPSLMRWALDRALAAGSLVIDRMEFGFPTAAEIDAVLHHDRGTRESTPYDPHGS